ncbi:MAG: 3-deoxy-D-manno-octulosonic acid transferase [Verrucomicrobiales bacterium]
MRSAVVRAAYNLVLPPLLVAALPAQWRKMRQRGGTAQDLKERLGWFRPATVARLASLEKPWWIHAVSVGEVLVAAKLIAAVRKLDPGQPLLLSTTTTTGHALAQRELPPDVPVVYNPVDLPGAVRRALDVARPGRLILVEAEVWPNWVHQAHEAGLEVVLVNARLSPRSERRYRAARWLVAPLLAQLDRVLVPEPEDTDRWSAIGVRPQAVRVTGNLKHDYHGWNGDPRTPAFSNRLASVWNAPLPPILLAASTHPGEEVLIARAFLDLRLTHPNLRLIVVPRHAERSGSVAADLSALGIKVLRRSMTTDPSTTDATTPPLDALLIDTTGELRAWYPLATAVVVGKSFLGRGGQNPVEALMAGRPVITGPHMENFASLMSSLTAHSAIIQVPDESRLVSALSELLASPEHSSRLAAAAHTALAHHQGAARRSAEILLGRATSE